MFLTRTQKFNKSNITTYFTEDPTRASTYKKYGGYKTIEEWTKLAEVENYQNYFNVLKKFSLLREYQRNGFDVEKIMQHRAFEKMTASDIYKLVRGKADRIHTVILSNESSEILNTKITDMIGNCLIAPDMGEYLPFPIMNDLFRGIKTGTMMCTGMLSNAGKSRFMFKIIAYLALVRKQKVSVLLNEMTIEKMRLCLLVTVINNPEFQALHKINITKKEKEIALGLYRNATGDFIERERDEWGEFTENEEDYSKRVYENSPEYQNVLAIAEWIENETDGLIYAKDVSTAYDDKSLEFEIRKMSMTQGIKYFFYDTLKQDTTVMGEWAALKATTTILSELTRELNVYIYASIQLTDDANIIMPDELNSMHISNAKQLKHVLDNLLLCKEIKPAEKKKYYYIENNADWGEPRQQELDENKRYYIFNIDKNRADRKTKLLFEIDLDKNTWIEIGEVFRK